LNKQSLMHGLMNDSS